MARTLSDDDVEAIAQRVATLLAKPAFVFGARAELPGNLISSGVVMARFGYRNRASFWQFVHSSGVPCVRLNARRIVFDDRQLHDWIERRSTGARGRAW